MNIISEDEFGTMLENFFNELPKKRSGNRPDFTSIDNMFKIDFYGSMKRRGEKNNVKTPEEMLKVVALIDFGTELPSISVGDRQVFTARDSINLSTGYKFAEQVLKLLKLSDEQINQIGAQGGEQFINELSSIENLEYVRDYPEIETFLQKLVSALGETKEAPEIEVDKDLDKIIQFFRKFDLDDKNDREGIYKYWEETDTLFNSLDNISLPIYMDNLQFRDVFGIDEETGKPKKVDLQSIQDNQGDDRELEKLVNNLLKKNIKIPKFTVTYKGNPSMEQFENKVTLIKLANEFIKPILGNTANYERYFEEAEDVNMREERQYSETDTGVESTQGASMDISVNTSESVLEDIRKIKRIGDPLSLLSAYNKGGFYISENLAEQLREMIEKELESVLTNVRPEIIESRLIKIRAFTEELITDLVNRDSYTFSIIDDSKNKYFLNKLEGEDGRFIFNLEYYQLEFKMGTPATVEFTKMEKPVSSYIQYVDEVNKMAKDLFKIIESGKNISNPTKFNRNRARGSMKGSAQTTLTQGRNYPPIAGKFAEANPDDVGQQLVFIYDELVRIVNGYYYEAMDARMFFKTDAPDFTRDKNYKKIISLSTKSRKSVLSGMQRRITTTSNIPITKKDLISLNEFFDKIKFYSRLSSVDAKKYFEQVQHIFRDLYMADLVIGDDENKRNIVTDITKKIKNSLGGLMFKLLTSAGTFNTEINLDEQVKVFGKPLGSYKEANVDFSELQLFDILEDEDFIQYSLESGMDRERKKLINTMKNNPLRVKQEMGDVENMYKSYLEALDLIRDKDSQLIYKAYLETENVEHMEYVLDLIAKEDRIDLYARDVEGIVNSNSSFNSLSVIFGVSTDVIYKVKGLFR